MCLFIRLHNPKGFEIEEGGPDTDHLLISIQINHEDAGAHLHPGNTVIGTGLKASDNDTCYFPNTFFTAFK